MKMSVNISITGEIIIMGWKWVVKIDFNESDLLKEILNFKIVNKKDLLEKYGFKNIKNINKNMKIDDINIQKDVDEKQENEEDN